MDRIRFLGVDDFFRVLSTAIATTELKAVFEIPLFCEDGAKKAEDLQASTMESVMMIAKGENLIAKLLHARDELRISSGLSNLRYQLVAMENWHSAAKKFMEEQVDEKADDTMSKFSDPDDARNAKITFSSLNSGQRQVLEGRLKKSEGMISDLREKIQTIENELYVPIEEDDAGIIQRFLPHQDYGS